MTEGQKKEIKNLIIELIDESYKGGGIKPMDEIEGISKVLNILGYYIEVCGTVKLKDINECE